MFCAVIFNWFRTVGLPAALPDVFSQRVLLYLLQQQQQSNIAATCIWNDNWDRYGDVKEEPWQSIKSRMARVKILDSMMRRWRPEHSCTLGYIPFRRVHFIFLNSYILTGIFFFKNCDNANPNLCLHALCTHVQRIKKSVGWGNSPADSVSISHVV